MPIRDFVCPSCGKEQERICQTDQKVVACKECGKDAHAKVSAPRGIHFKGSGFYATDYKGK